MIDMEWKLVIGRSGWNYPDTPEQEAPRQGFFMQMYLQKDYDSILTL